MGSIVKMYVSGNGGTDSSQIDVPMAGHLVGIDWSVDGDADADAEYLRAQVSFRSTISFTTNDDRGVISEVGETFALTTSGVYRSSIQKYVPLPDLPVGPGERLYLHADATAGLLSTVVALLHFDFDIDKVSSRRR